VYDLYDCKECDEEGGKFKDCEFGLSTMNCECDCHIHCTICGNEFVRGKPYKLDVGTYLDIRCTQCDRKDEIYLDDIKDNSV
jgi:hypothetical protein